MERYLVKKRQLPCAVKEDKPESKRLCCDGASGVEEHAHLCRQKKSEDDVLPTEEESNRGCSGRRPSEEEETRDHTELVTNTSVNTRIMKEGLNLTYYPRFISSRQSSRILIQLESELSPYFTSSKAVSTVKMKGIEYPIPRQQTAFGDDGLSYTFSGVTIPALPWSPTVMKLREGVQKVTKHSFNFALVNRYRNGLDHMGEHQDNERDLCSESPIVSLTFGQERDFVFRHKDSRGRAAKRKDIAPVKLCLAHGSLLVMNPPTNTEWYHALPIRKKAPMPRINITFRAMKINRQ